jgi:SpoVK/Ycf46/Vps4 family AAA+-type ATPase
MRGVPVGKGYSEQELSALATADLFSPKRILFQVNSRTNKQADLPFTLADCVTGAMIHGVVDQASTRALKRDLKENTTTGVLLEDFQVAVRNVYRQHSDLNPAFDLEDFCDRRGLAYNQDVVARKVALCDD